ncbi:MAG: hypothetical protein WBC07_13300 [Methylotenera sp.]
MKQTNFYLAAILLATSSMAFAGEFGDRCTTGLTKGVVVATDCSISEDYNGNKLCFGNEEAKTMFLDAKDKQKFIKKAAAFYPKVLNGMAK